MNPVHIVALTSALLAAAVPYGAQAQLGAASDESIETRVWLDRGVDPVFESGDQARVYYRSSVDAYVLLFHINTDGALRLLFPGGSEQAIQETTGARDYRLRLPDSDQWVVDEPPGVGYFFVLAAREPFAFDRLSELEVAGGWDSSPDGNRIVDDPYVVVDEFRRVLLPAAEPSRYAIDFTAYHVGQPYSYPRFICYQCHLEQTFDEWNPYLQTCMDFRVVIYNDPYYYSATRYRGDRVVYARPPEPGLPQFGFARRLLGEAGTPVVQSRTAAVRSSPSDRFRGAGSVSIEELLRNVGQTGLPGSNEAPARGLLPVGPDRRRPAVGPPSVSGPAPEARPPVVRPGDTGSARPTLRRRDERAPASR